MSKWLLVSGTALMLVGMIHGFAPDLTPNRALGISAHVAAIQNGTILVVFGLAWSYTDLGRFDQLTGVLLVVGMYGLWIGLFLAAAMNLRSPGASDITMLIQLLSSISLVIGVSLVLYGFIRKKDA